MQTNLAVTVTKPVGATGVRRADGAERSSALNAPILYRALSYESRSHDRQASDGDIGQGFV